MRVNPVLKGIDGGDPGKDLDNPFEMVAPGAAGVGGRVKRFKELVAQQFHAHGSDLTEFNGRMAIGIKVLVPGGERVKGMTGLV